MIEPAYTRLGILIGQTLAGNNFGAPLKIDPPAPFTPSGNERSLVFAAALVSVQTASVRQILGRPIPRHVVERQCRVELAVAGPARAEGLQINADVLNALAVLPGLNPTLDGKAERFLLIDQTDDELPPNGLSVFLNFLIRVRSGDPLGRTP